MTDVKWSTNQTSRPTPICSQGASCLCDVPFCVWPPREEQKTKQKNCSEQVIARGKQRSKETAPKEGRGSQERLEPTLFLVGCGFRTLIAPQQDRIRDSHMETP